MSNETPTEPLEWIERTVTVQRVSIFRDEYTGMHYEATRPRNAGDVEVSHRAVTTESGIVLGAHPELGAVHYASGAIPTTHIGGGAA